MIQLRALELPPPATSALQALQAEVDALPTYVERVKAVPRRFKNAVASAAFKDVKRTLEAMSSSNSRCMLCEDSAANEVEHVRPKSLYPEASFDWSNYVYSCGVCNKCKGSKFAVFAGSAREFVDVTRQRGSAIIPPVVGSPVFLHPRYEDSTRFLGLDLIDTFYFYPLALAGTDEHRRAQYTIDRLKLNVRDPLRRQRRQYFEIYVAQVEAYLHDRARGATEEELRERRDRVRVLGHPTVWYEMRRQHGRIPRLRGLFESLPEALLWDSTASATSRWPAEKDLPARTER